ncbi:hypothetical protein KFE98_10225 [bacterium SCSIO 12741]|nr:hypothetical protein KFE98_10225 [bacterium SCSIO 12741]
MKKRLILLTLLTGFVFGACNNCYVCEYTNAKGERKSTSEICNDKDGLDNLEKDLNERYGQYGDVFCMNTP